MNIVVCIKQVPFVEHLRLDPATRRLVREGTGEINPFDRRAISAAIEIRNRFGGLVTALTMGPPQAKEALIEALAMGCDRAIHLLGNEFAGSDTLATARALARACGKLGFDLVLCGKYSTDAETAQVPPMLAELLDVPQITGVTQLEFAQDPALATATRELDDGFEVVQFAPPAVLSTAERLIKPIRVTPQDVESARQRPILVWSAADLGGDPTDYGAAGSPTRVSEIYSIEPERKRIVRTVGDNVRASPGDQAIQATVRDLLAEGLFGQWKSDSPRIIRPHKGGGTRERAVWVVAELVGAQIRPITFEILGRGVELTAQNGGELAVVLIGYNIGPHIAALAAHGAGQVYLADAPELATYASETYTAVLAQAIRTHDPYAVLLPSTANGRDLAPRVAARLGAGLTGDCIGLKIDDQGRLVQFKPAFGGSMAAPILSRTRPAMATIRPGILQCAEPDFSRVAAVEQLPAGDWTSRTVTISIEESASAGLELDEAEIVVGVGMGSGGAQNLPAVQALASVLGAALSATRRVVDAGWLPRQVQVGLTGRSIAPKLYVAVGTSGKFNHVVGIQRAGLVLAINKDANSEMFQHCDYGLVGDWAVVVPALEQALTQARLQAAER